MKALYQEQHLHAWMILSLYGCVYYFYALKVQVSTLACGWSHRTQYQWDGIEIKGKE